MTYIVQRTLNNFFINSFSFYSKCYFCSELFQNLVSAVWSSGQLTTTDSGTSLQHSNPSSASCWRCVNIIRGDNLSNLRSLLEGLCDLVNEDRRVTGIYCVLYKHQLFITWPKSFMHFSLWEIIWLKAYLNILIPSIPELGRSY